MARVFRGIRNLRSDSNLSEDGTMQTCNVCNCSFPVDAKYFTKDKQTRSGFYHTCKNCVKLKRKKNEPEYDASLTRTCTKCSESFPLTIDNFSISNRGKNGIKSICKRCDSLYHKIRYAIDDGYRLAKRISVSKRNKRLNGTFSNSDVKILFDLQGGLCAYCQCEIHNGYHIEHFVPINNGGSNKIDNLVLACKSCNLRKGKMDYSQFFNRLFNIKILSTIGSV